MERDWFSIEEIDGEKVVHYHGWSYYHGENERGEEEYSFVDLTHCYIPLANLVGLDDEERSLVWGEAAELVQQYQGEFGIEESQEMVEGYYGLVVFSLGQTECYPGTYLSGRDLTMDTPLGSYWS